jgi:succinyl-diaminopimelate desuccinylase
MPLEAEILVDVRTVPGQSHLDIQNDLIALAACVEKQVEDFYGNYDRTLNLHRNHCVKIRVDFLADRPCTQTDKNDPIVRAADWAVRRVSGTEPVYAGVPGATDGTFLWAFKNIPIVTMGAGDRQLPHQVDEWVDLDQLINTAEIYSLAALHYLYPKPDKPEPHTGLF